ncbi:hypothetical protein [Parahaliea mediterranea]|uniref:Uncharacterized protein n=1 Tax=Parahaliea mediterranea TaxID=651086 RepID=A0A939DF00_9GAMM|nr:hypothetical protein [Parahaliea mediterranea]MBN7796312.1 hypothetical protein [Parahaliea mediterranea]
MDVQYTVYFAGEILPGHDHGAVRDSLGKLFKAGDATLDKLFSGKPQLIKRHCDKATALKYKQAMERAGAKPLIKRSGGEPAAASGETPQPAQRPMTMAERVAAVAAGGDTAAPASPAPPPASTATATENENENDGISLAEAGADVLRADERSAPAPRDIDTAALSLAASGERLSEEGPAAPPAPDTSHLSMGAVGERIPGLARAAAPAAPDTSAIGLSPAGGDLSDCAPPPAAPPALDLSAIELAPEGSDVLEPRYRRTFDEAAPDTSHLSVDTPS